MDKEVSIVRVDTRHHRTIAQENWGLTNEQMKGMHVHHRIPRSKGGTNDPSILYVCSPSFHKNCWHAEDSYNSLIPYAELGGIAARDNKLGIHGLSEEERQAYGKMGGEAGGWKKSQERNIGIFGDRTEWRDIYVESGRKQLKTLIDKNPNHQRDVGILGGERARELRVGIHASGVAAKGGKAGGKVAVESGQLTRARTPESVRKGGVAAGNTLYADPDHPELGHHNAGVLVRKQKKLGYPSEKANRVKVGVKLNTSVV
jgi:hypothetical protein